jgi:hypothetical protein
MGVESCVRLGSQDHRWGAIPAGVPYIRTRHNRNSYRQRALLKALGGGFASRLFSLEDFRQVPRPVPALLSRRLSFG